MTSQLFKFTVYLALVVVEVESLSKVMTNMNHMSFAFDEADSVGENKKVDSRERQPLKRPILPQGQVGACERTCRQNRTT